MDLFMIWPMDQFYKDYEKLEPIGHGQYGEVFSAKPLSKKIQESVNSSIVAVKFLKCKRASEKLRIRDEIDILKDLHHDNILKLLGAYEQNDEFIEVLEYLR